MDTSYEKGVVAWANEQAALLRAGKLTAIDIEHIAEEIEDVGRSEQRDPLPREPLPCALERAFGIACRLHDARQTAENRLCSLSKRFGGLH